MKVYLIYQDGPMPDYDKMITLMTDRSKAYSLVKKLNNKEVYKVGVEELSGGGQPEDDPPMRYTFVDWNSEDHKKKPSIWHWLRNSFNKYYVVEREVWAGNNIPEPFPEPYLK